MSLTLLRKRFRKTIKPVLLGFAGIFFLSCFTFYGNNIIKTQKNEGGEFVIAKVNGEEIPRDLYERYSALLLRQYEMMMQQQGQKGRVDFNTQNQARGRAFQEVVDSYLKAQAAQKEGIQISRGEVRKRIDEQIKEQISGPRLDGATAEEKAQYEAQLRALMPEAQMQKQLLNEALEKKLRERFKPNEQDVIANYNEVKLSHILIKTITGRPDAEALQKANQALAKLKGGADFTKLAQELSDDPNSKNQGGDLGWVNGESPMVAEFKSAALKLKKGDLTGPVKTMFGYHILRADDTRSKLPKDFNDPKKKEEYRAQVEERVLRERLENYYGTLRITAKIDPYDPFIAGFMLENEASGLASAGDTKGYAEKLRLAAAKYEAATVRNGPEIGPALWSKLAQMYNATKQDDKAIAAVKRALDYSKSAELYVTLGEIYERKKKKAEAVKAYEQAMGLCYDQPWQFTSLQLKFKALGRDDLAKKAYGKWQEFVQKDNAAKKRAAQLTDKAKKAGETGKS